METRLKANYLAITGTMSGGGKSVSKGRMGGKIVQDIVPKDVEKIEKNVESSVAQVEVCLFNVSSSHTLTQPYI